LKDADGNDINQVIDNVYALKWSYSVGDTYPVCALSYMSGADAQAHLTLPASDINLDMDLLGWEFSFSAGENGTSSSSLCQGKIKIGYEYVEINASRSLENGKPVNKIALSFMPILAKEFVSLDFDNGYNSPVILCNGQKLGGISRCVLTMDAKREPVCEAVFTVEYDSNMPNGA